MGQASREFAFSFDLTVTKLCLTINLASIYFLRAEFECWCQLIDTHMYGKNIIITRIFAVSPASNYPGEINIVNPRALRSKLMRLIFALGGNVPILLLYFSGIEGSSCNTCRFPKYSLACWFHVEPILEMEDDGWIHLVWTAGAANWRGQVICWCSFTETVGETNPLLPSLRRSFMICSQVAKGKGNVLIIYYIYVEWAERVWGIRNYS